MRKIFITIIFVFGLFSNLSFASDNFVSQRKVLDQNGLTVIATQMPGNPMVALYALVKTGSATEGEFLGSGISHYLEHMLFKGTQKRKMGEIASQIQALGGEINASTSMDFTIYTIQVPVSAFDEGLDILADMLMNSAIDPQEAQKEREVIHGEMRLHNDNPDRKLNELVSQTTYLEHPYKHPIIGYEELFDKISPEQLKQYYQSHYVPNNIVVSIAGGVTVSEILPKIEEKFKSYSRAPYIPRQLSKEADQMSPRRYEGFYPTPLTRLSLSFPGVGLLDRDLYALDVLSMILGQGESSRLYKDLYKDQKLVEGISASNSTPVDPGMFEIEATLDDNNRKLVIQKILEHINIIKTKLVDQKELDKAKRQVLVDYVFGNQTVGQVAWHQAMDEAFTGDYTFSEKYIDAVRGVTKEDIGRVAKQYLRDEAVNIVLLRPKDKEQEQVLDEKSVKKNDAQKIILENGLTLILKEDHSFPIVSVNLSLLGGLRYEPDNLNGLSYLMTNLWLKGTKKHTARQIEQWTEERGIGLGPTVGRNSLGLSLSFLSEDTDEALKLFKEILFEPTFPNDEMELIKKDMKTALKYRDENIHRFTRFRLDQILFKGHPFEKDNLGSEESINSINQKNIIEYYQSLIDPKNLILTIYGDIEPAHITALLKNDLLKVQDKNFQKKKFTADDLKEKIEKELPYQKEQALVMFGFKGPEIYSNDRFNTEVLASILGSSFSGRLFNSVREELGQAYTMGADYIPSLDTGMIYVYVFTSPETVYQVKELVEKQIKLLQAELVSDQELNDMKTYLKGNFKSELQTIAAQAQLVSLDELYGMGFNYYQKYDENIDKVTKEAVQSAAQKYFDLTKAVVVVTKPLQKAEHTEK